MALKYFEILEGRSINISDKSTYIREREKDKTLPIVEFKSAPITLAELDSLCAGKFTAHRIADYRKKQFSLILLPNVQILFDNLLVQCGVCT